MGGTERIKAGWRRGQRKRKGKEGRWKIERKVEREDKRV